MDLYALFRYDVVAKLGKKANERSTTMQTKQTDANILSPDKLIEKLAIAAAEAYEIGATEENGELTVFNEAINLVAKTWALSEASVTAARVTPNELIEMINADDYNPEEDIFMEKAVLNSGGSERGLQILHKLQETAAILGDKDKRKILNVISYIEDFGESQN